MKYEDWKAQVTDEVEAITQAYTKFLKTIAVEYKDLEGAPSEDEVAAFMMVKLGRLQKELKE